MKNGEKPIANPFVMLREEFDDWAILFDPDSGHGFGLSPTGVYVWKLFDGEHSLDEMLTVLRQDALDVPEEAGEQIVAFVEEITLNGLAGYEGEQFHQDRAPTPCPTGLGTGPFTYEPPRLVNLSSKPAAGYCCNHGTGATGDGCGCFGYCVAYAACGDGACAGSDCGVGNSPGGYCLCGNCGDDYADCGRGIHASNSCNQGNWICGC